MNINIINEKIIHINALQKEYKRKSNVLSILRLIAFIIFLGLFIIGVTTVDYLVLFSLIVFLSFVFLIIIHEKVTSKERYYNFHLQTLNEYLDRFNDRWKYFDDGGIDFLNDADNIFLADLDIIGDASLFKYLNVTKTRNGRKKLIERLSNPHFKIDELIEKQNSMKEISEENEFSLKFQATLKEYAHVSPNLHLRSTVKILANQISFNYIHLYFGIFLSISTLLLLVLSLIGLTSWIWFLDLFFLQLGFSYIFLNKYKNTFKDITTSSASFSSLEKVFKVVAETKFKDNNLNSYKENIINYGLRGIKEINMIKDLDTFRLNFLTYLIFNGIFSMNVFVIFLFFRYQKKYSANLESSVEAIEELEVLTSLAVLGQVKANKCLPTYSKDVSLCFDNLKHPLLREEECIGNDFSKDDNVNIITGSNMSGKTSFLRTIGINLILMNAGGYVNGQSFVSTYLKIFTSMRISDDISKGISTFYAELLRIKKAIEYQKTNLPMIALIDEVFKGTNSNDRIKGAISLVEKFSKDNVILFITTHDFELCDIDLKISNYHFSEYYQEDKIMFDYKLKNGKCETTNAEYLMKLAGIRD